MTPTRIQRWIGLVLIGATLPVAAARAADHDAVDAVAIYNQGAAVVQDTREIELTAGGQTLAWPVAGRLRPDTLWLAGAGVRLTGLSARGNAGIDSGGARLAARVGRPVTLLRDTPKGETTRDATLVGVDGSAVLVRVDERIERLTDASPWRLAWPAGRYASNDGGLRLDVEAEDAGTQAVTATYQIDGPSWQISYTGHFDAKAGRLALQGLAVIDNTGGAALEAGRAWLVAGDVARANRGPHPVAMAAREAKFDAPAPEAAGDTYRYALDGGLHVPAGAVRAIALTDAPLQVDATRRYRFENSAYAGQRDGALEHARIRLSFDNTSKQPLPAGVVRVYASDRDADLMGEDQLGNTPAGAPVTLVLGHSFDVTAERRVTDESHDDGRRRRTLEITVHNAGERTAPVTLVEHLPNAAEIVSTSRGTAPQQDADAARWRFDVPAHGRTTLRYRVAWKE